MGQAIYLEIYEEMKKKIQEGSLPAGSKLPSKRSLAREKVISINTVENAYALLLEEGYVESKERKGYFVANLDLVLKRSREEEKIHLSHQEEKQYLYDFSYRGVDDFPFGLWKRLVGEVLSKEKTDLLSHGHVQGSEQLREAIVSYLYHSRGILGKKENVVVSAGTEYLFPLLFPLWEDKRFGIEDPGFELWSMLFENNHVDYVPLAMDMEGIRPKDVEKENVDILCITPSHQFPTGKIMPMKRRLALLEWAKEKDGWIIEDDYDGEFKYQGRPIPALKSIDAYEKVIYMGSFSNTLTPSIRISYMLLPDSLMQKYHGRLAYAACPVPILTQYALSLFIKRGYFMRHVNRMRKVYKEKREKILHIVAQYPWMRVVGAEAGLHVVVQWLGDQREEDLLARARKEGILIHSMKEYAIRTKEEGKYFILGFANMSKQELEEGIGKLVSAWT